MDQLPALAAEWFAALSPRSCRSKVRKPDKDQISAAE
jgi:hypothetical protein